MRALMALCGSVGVVFLLGQAHYSAQSEGIELAMLLPQDDPAAGQPNVAIEPAENVPAVEPFDTLELQQISKQIEVLQQLKENKAPDAQASIDVLLVPLLTRQAELRQLIGTTCLEVGACADADDPLAVPFNVSVSRRSYTVQGVKSFINVFSAAAERGVENATIRAMNSTKACAKCD